MEDVKIHIGKMDRRIEVIRKTTVKSATGAETKTSTVLASVWAKRESNSSDKLFEDQVIFENSFVYYLRHQTVIAAQNIQDLYLVDQGVEFEVFGVEVLGRRDYIKIRCRQRG